MKPIQAKAKAKAAATVAAAPKAAVAAVPKPKAAPVNVAPSDNLEEGEKAYGIRRHKRKTANGETKIFAINVLRTGKQLGQLTETATKDAEEIIKNMVDRLNSGTPKEDILNELNAKKTG